MLTCTPLTLARALTRYGNLRLVVGGWERDPVYRQRKLSVLKDGTVSCHYNAPCNGEFWYRSCFLGFDTYKPLKTFQEMFEHDHEVGLRVEKVYYRKKLLWSREDVS